MLCAAFPIRRRRVESNEFVFLLFDLFWMG